MTPEERRLLPLGLSRRELQDSFAWSIPKEFNIAEACCDSWARDDPDRVALIHVGEDGTRQDWTYGALKRASDCLANSFHAQGLKRGDRVAILLQQGPAVLISHFAAFKLGAITLPLFSLFGEEALAYRLADSGAKIAVTDDENLHKLTALQPNLPDLAEIYSIDGTSLPVRSFWDEIDAAADQGCPVKTLAEDPAVLIYTSGTTGAPKGTLHAHRFLFGHLPCMELSHEGFPQAGDCGWTPADWAWIGGLMDMAMPCLYYGVPQISRRMRKFDPDEAYALIAKYKIRNLFMPPTALRLMQHSKVPEGVQLRSIASGGESLGAELLDWGRENLSVPINEIYGQTECNLVVACHGSDRTPDAAIGQAVPGHRVAIIDDQGTCVAAGRLGEIAVHRPDPSMFLGYWNQPEQTQAKFAGNWLKTGDIGIMDGDGFITYVSRDDDVITSAGYRIGPTEIENCLMGHPDVVSAAVIGLPDPIKTQVVKAFVVLRPGAKWAGLEHRLIRRVKSKVSPHLAPRYIAEISEMPTTATGKIIRQKLRDRG